MEKVVQYHAWYSPTQEITRRSGVIPPHTPNKYGDEPFDYKSIAPRMTKNTPGCIYWVDRFGSNVETTMVTKTPEHGCNTKYLPDLQYQGLVTKYSGVCRW